jgi:hypothetical protein
MSQTAYPSEIDLLSFFGIEPVRLEDLYQYTVGGAGGLTLRFSFNPVEDTIQTWLGHVPTPVAVVSHEKLARMWIDGDVLRAECEYGTGRVQLALTVEPAIKVEWVGLRTA